MYPDFRVQLEMCERLNMTDTAVHSGLITRDQLMTDLGITDTRKIQKMIEMGDLPKPSFGGKGDVVVGWHKDVISHFYLERLERQQGQ